MKKYIFIMICLISPTSFAIELSTDLKPIELLARVKYIDVENGFYGFETADNVKYMPTNMPDSFKQDGLPVQVLAVRQSQTVGIHMWGEYIRVIMIQKIDCDEIREETAMLCYSDD